MEFCSRQTTCCKTACSRGWRRAVQSVVEKQQAALTAVGSIEEAMVKGFPFTVPSAYDNLPQLKVRSKLCLLVNVWVNMQAKLQVQVSASAYDNPPQLKVRSAAAGRQHWPQSPAAKDNACA
jgi:hypothetical protein